MRTATPDTLNFGIERHTRTQASCQQGKNGIVICAQKPAGKSRRCGKDQFADRRRDRLSCS
jgi:hypothetical protein